MSYIRYNIYKSSERNLGDSVKELLRNVSLSEHPIRLVFFLACGDDYGGCLSVIRGVVNNWYRVKTPLITLVAQRGLDCRIGVEIHSIDKHHLSDLEIKHFDGVMYAVLNGDKSKMLFSEGVRSKAKLTKKQAEDVFVKLRGVLNAEEMNVCDIDRQWNYLEDITGREFVGNDFRQKYQEFNDARSEFYVDQNWTGGYPAATGIGTVGGGVVVEIDAAIKSHDGVGLRTVGVDNGMQISAHRYSGDVLCGEAAVKTTPKFERARAIVNESIFGDKKAQIYISGTAAIRGEDSLEQDIEKQTLTTIENVEYLISKENLRSFGVDLMRIPKVQVMRVYVKRDEDFEVVKGVLVRKYPTVPMLFVKSEVCRKELLVEIEGVAE